MGLFRRRKKNKDANDHSTYQNIVDDVHSIASYNYDQSLLNPSYNFPSQSSRSPASVSSRSRVSESSRSSSTSNDNGHNSSSSGIDDQSTSMETEIDIVTLDELPFLINEIQSCHKTYSVKPAKALRSLFTLSEDEQFSEINRIRMVRECTNDSMNLIPVLLQFIQKCQPSSSEQYLALLVLNNVSIPSENKRLVAIEHGGAAALSRLFCQYPNIPLIGIILANLSFCDASLRKKLVGGDTGDDMQILEALVYVLKVSMDLNIRQHKHKLKKVCSTPRVMLGELNQNLTTSQMPSFPSSSSSNNNEYTFNQDDIAFPESARWVLCSIRNLTRPPYHQKADQILIQYGVIPMLLHILTVDKKKGGENSMNINNKENNYLQKEKEDESNIPYHWDGNSIQDIALYIVMNLALCASTIPTLHHHNVENVLSNIAKYSSSLTTSPRYSRDEEKHKDLQCLKARMILAYLLNSTNQLGGDHDDKENMKDYSYDLLLLKGSEAVLLVELLANTLHGRGKPGAGGYNATTFSLKGVLCAIRYLLTNKINAKTLYVTSGVKLNALLFKALSVHAIQDFGSIDSEAAEAACFSLYVLSNNGFMSPFLPTEGFPFYQVIYCYFKKDSCTRVGRQCAKQLIFRSLYLNFEGNIYDEDDQCSIQSSDLELEDALLYAAEDIKVDNIMAGSKPLDDVFGRPLTRRKQTLIKNGLDGNDVHHESITFNSALDAVQHFSFDASNIEGQTHIDDIEIANKIVICANGDESEYLGFKWTWEDGEIHEQEVRSKLNEFRKRKVESFRGLLKNVSIEGKNFVKPNEPINFFGFKCGERDDVVG